MKFHKLPHFTRDVTGQHYRPLPSDVSLPRISERRRRLKFRLSSDRNIRDHLCPHISVGIFRPKFAVPFLTKQFLALIRESGRRIWNDKSHFYWLAQFYRKMSFHFPQVFPLISDRSVWHNGKHPRFPPKHFIREFKQIATAGADTAAGSKFPQKWDTAHVRWLHPAVANLVPRAHVPFGQHQDTELWNNQFPETKILGLPASRRMRGLV